MAEAHEDLAPDGVPDSELDRLLGQRETVPDDQFVLTVMHRVQRERRSRKLILFGFGLIGALFGLLGALLLAAPIAHLFTGLPATGIMQAALVASAAAAFYVWSMNDDFSRDSARRGSRAAAPAATGRTGPPPDYAPHSARQPAVSDPTSARPCSPRPATAVTRFQCRQRPGAERNRP
jgi:hypothetical protein